MHYGEKAHALRSHGMDSRSSAASLEGDLHAAQRAIQRCAADLALALDVCRALERQRVPLGGRNYQAARFLVHGASNSQMAARVAHYAATLALRHAGDCG